jgi:hypothetical protein
MFTIDGEGDQYPDFWVILGVAKQLSVDLGRSVTIYKNGKPFKFLRY